MRKEFWVLFFILGTIFTVIWGFSKWNSVHLMKKLRRIHREQEVICDYMVDKARGYGIAWDAQTCKKIIVGRNPDDWDKLRKCTMSKQLDFLKCMGSKLCKMSETRGCLLENETYLRSSEQKIKNKGLKYLESSCDKHDFAACTILALWYRQNPDKKGLFRKKERSFRKKACLAGNIDMCKKPDYVRSLEECSAEDVKNCLKHYEFSEDPLVFYLACSYGSGKACRQFYEKLTGMTFSLETVKNLHISKILPGLCLAGDTVSCGLSAVLQNNAKLLKTACKNGDPSSCTRLLKSGKIRLSALTERFLKFRLCSDGYADYCPSL